MGSAWGSFVLFLEENPKGLSGRELCEAEDKMPRLLWWPGGQTQFQGAGKKCWWQNVKHISTENGSKESPASTCSLAHVKEGG